MLPSRNTLIFSSIMLATVVQAVDITITTVALPKIQASIAGGSGTAAWILTAYLVASAIAMPAAASLDGVLSRKTILALCIGGFTAASMLCGFAENVAQMVLFRILQGAFAGGIVPLSQVTVLDTHPPHRQGRAMGLWGAAAMVGPVLGPSLGAWLSDAYDWRWIFWINLPFGLAAMAGVIFAMPARAARVKRRIDTLGFSIFSIGIGALQLALDRGNHLGWRFNQELLIEALIAFVALAGAFRRAAFHPSAFPQIAAFRDRNFATATTASFLIGFILLGTITLIPLLAQNVLQLGAAATSSIMTPRGIGTMLTMLIVGRLIGHIEHRLLLTIGVFVSLVAIVPFMLIGDTSSTASLAIASLFQGVGIGLLYTPLSTAAFISLRPEDKSHAAGLYALFRSIGGSVGVSVASAVATHFSTSEMLPSAAGIRTAFGVIAGLTLMLLPAVLLVRVPRRPVDDETALESAAATAA
jgi:DHA2 family multidrug resistance protein